MKFTKHYATLTTDNQWLEDDMPADTLNSFRMYQISLSSGMKYGYNHMEGFYNMTYFHGQLVAAVLAKETKKGWLFEIYT